MNGGSLGGLGYPNWLKLSLCGFFRGQQGHDLGVADLVHDEEGEEAEGTADNGHQGQIQPEGNLHDAIFTWKW
jgi:hypothetical protein